MSITRQLAGSGINVLAVHVHRSQTGVLGEFVFACQEGIQEDALIR